MAAKRYALSVDCCLNHLLVLAEMQGCGRSELADPQGGQPGAPVHERSHRTGIIEVQQCMAAQVRRSLERSRTVAQQRWTAYREDFFAEEPDRSLRHHVRRTVADRKIHQAALQIEHVDGCRDAHIDAGMQTRESRQERE